MSSNVIAFSLTVKLFHHDNPDFWIIILELFFGFGAAFAPFLSLLFSLRFYQVLAALTVVVIPFSLKFPLPDVQE